MISSSQNPEIKLIRSLEKRKYREREKLFVVEGIRIIEDALADGAEFERIIYSPTLLGNPRGLELLRRLESKGVRCLSVDQKLFADLAGTETPQGLLAVLHQPDYSLEDLLTHRGLYDHIILINGVQDPGNLGTILRTAAGAGWSGVIITPGTVDLYNPKSLRATMGAIFKLPICKVEDLDSLWVSLKNAGYQMIATSLEANEWYYTIDYTKPTVLVVGNEGSGIEEAILQKADYLVKIPMAPEAESLNVAIAAGIVIFEGVRQNLVKLS